MDSASNGKVWQTVLGLLTLPVSFICFIFFLFYVGSLFEGLDASHDAPGPFALSVVSVLAFTFNLWLSQRIRYELKSALLFFAYFFALVTEILVVRLSWFILSESYLFGIFGSIVAILCLLILGGGVFIAGVCVGFGAERSVCNRFREMFFDS